MKTALLQILQHTIGANQYGEIPTGYERNHFVTGEQSKDWDKIQELIALGLMKCHGRPELAGGNYCFSCTPQGINTVIKESPAPPKVSRARRRYLRYLEIGDLFESFRDFLVWDSRQNG